jgi:prepilin-type N-terminal cleavage/methylation domain-containing protein
VLETLPCSSQRKTNFSRGDFEMRNQKGFTLVELMVVVIVMVVIVLFVLIIPAGRANSFYTEEGVLRSLQVDHPEISKIIKTTRNIYNYSEIWVETKAGEKRVYLLDTNFLFNYEFRGYKMPSN